MSNWVLIVVLTVGGMGTNGAAIHSIPFAAESACESAKRQLKELDGRIDAICVSTAAGRL